MTDDARAYAPPPAFAAAARVAPDAYAAAYRQSVDEPDAFWREQAARLAGRIPKRFWAQASSPPVD